MNFTIQGLRLLALSTLVASFQLIFCNHSNATIYSVNLTGDANVSSGATSGDFRWCFTQANASAGNSIVFSAYPGALPATITLGGSLPAIVQNGFTIDGTTAPGYNCATGPRIFIKGPGWGSVSTTSVSNVVIKGIGFVGQPVIITGGNLNTVQGCWFNLTTTGNAIAAGSASIGNNAISVDGSTNAIIGGTACGQGNSLAGHTGCNGIIYIQNGSNGANVSGNYVGLGADGTSSVNLSSSAGILISSSSSVTINANTIVNCMDGSSGFGIRTSGTGNTNSITITNNKIGLNASGIKNATNYGCAKGGIDLDLPASDVTITGNIVCDNGNNASCNGAYQSGIVTNASAPGITGTSVINNNYVGVDPNYNLAGNQFSGIYLLGTATGVVISGNIVGDNGKCAAQKSNGISFAGTGVTNITIKGNYIGVSPTSLPIGNWHNGIEVNGAGSGILIGGTAAGDGNFVCNNKGTRPAATDPNAAGVFVTNTPNVTIYGNIIGVAPNGSAAGQLNAGGGSSANNGIFVENATAQNVIIGGFGAGEDNDIAYSGTYGVGVWKGADFVRIRNNHIYCNSSKGIWLNYGAGANQGNNGFPAPVINVSQTAPTAGYLNKVTGTVATPNAIIDIYTTLTCAAACNVNPQGAQWLATVTADGAGNWSYTNATTIYNYISATASSPGCGASNCRTSEFSTCVTNNLPVQLLSFTASKWLNQSVKLNWQTASEKNNNKFIVERSADAISFEIVGELPGAENSSQVLSYSLMDINPLQGNNYYRLRQVDNDGNYAQSEIRLVNFSNQTSVSIYPNPNNGSFNVEVYQAGNASESNVNISVCNALGEVVYANQSFSKDGMINEKVNLQKFAAGIYLIKIQTDSDIFEEKIIVE